MAHQGQPSWLSQGWLEQGCGVVIHPPVFVLSSNIFSELVKNLRILSFLSFIFRQEWAWWEGSRVQGLPNWRKSRWVVHKCLF